MLFRSRDKVQERYMDLCEDGNYLYLLKAPDRKNVYSRIADIILLVNDVLGEDGEKDD